MVREIENTITWFECFSLTKINYFLHWNSTRSFISFFLCFNLTKIYAESYCLIHTSQCYLSASSHSGFLHSLKLIVVFIVGPLARNCNPPSFVARIIKYLSIFFILSTIGFIYTNSLQELLKASYLFQIDEQRNVESGKLRLEICFPEFSLDNIYFKSSC